MKFTHQRLFVYDKVLFQPEELDLAYTHAQAYTNEHVTLSGLMDLRETLLITAEYYVQFPKYDVKELARPEQGGKQIVDDLYGEVVGSRLEFNRKLQVPAMLTHGDPLLRHGKKGTEREQPITLDFHTLILQDMDYFPETGDHVIYLGTLFEMTRVFYRADALFQNTGVPLYVTAVATPFQFGDKKAPGKINGPLPKRGSKNS